VAIARKLIYRYISLIIIGLILFICLSPAIAQSLNEQNIDPVSLVWLMFAGSLIFFMNAGFAMLEAGLCQTQNSINVLAKNLIVFCVSIFAFWLVGFGLMFGEGNPGWGETGFLFRAFAPPFNNSFPASFIGLQTLYPQQSFIGVFFFQLVFAGTTATIVSGAVAERIRFWAFFWFSFLLIAIAYPLTGRWVWGVDGWLATGLNFLDFAGSTVVHSVGGMAGLVGAILIGPRRGWQGYNPYETNGSKFTSRRKNFGYYNLTFSTLGCLILWLGWLGFNGGSAKEISHIPHIIITTMMAAAAGGVFILFLRGLRRDKPTLASVINGILGGLVGITASSAYVSLSVAIFIGAVSSLCVLLGEKLLEYYKIDDPVGAIPVHLGCGIWGTFATGLFVNQLPPYINYPVERMPQIFSQVIGILTVNLTTLCLSIIFWLVIGWGIYYVEVLNNKIDLDRGDRTDTIDPGSTSHKFLEYLHLARTSLRVSSPEEMAGSDGTFISS
jgi:ammonium transporter, Amt family